MRMKSPLLTHHPELEKTGEGVWRFSTSKPFFYTDGTASEVFIARVLKRASDLGALSRELETSHAPWDWNSEYHLSPRRANLLRGLDLGNVTTVLELGSGCGAITRFLGEAGFQVDAVEGSRERARITRMRCRELDNVTVVNADFNELRIPQNAYDAVFFIGVMEYAARFLPGAGSAEKALIQIMAGARSALKPEGLMVIAIENRQGLKYWLGATEDHFAEPHVGLAGYPGSRGTKTFDWNEWQRLLKQTKMAYRFLFPFPDYKLTDVLMSRDFLASDPNAHSLLYRVRSRDYVKAWQPEGSEFLIWRSLHQQNELHRFANSFLILASENRDRVDAAFPYDFICFPGLGRRPEYRSVTAKPKGGEVVVKSSLFHYPHPGTKSVRIRQHTGASPYRQGELLSTLWLTALSTPADIPRFQHLLKKYYELLLEETAKGRLDDFDVLPSNIVVSEGGRYLRIDTEWSMEGEILPDFVFFRALFWFSVDNHQSLKTVFKNSNIYCPKDFIHHGFQWIEAPISEKELLQWIQTEEAIHDVVAVRGVTKKSIAATVSETFASYFDGGMASMPDTLRINWSDDAEDFSEEQSLHAAIPEGNAESGMVFRFRSMSPVTRLKIWPTMTGGYFLFDEIRLDREGDGGVEETIFEIQGFDAICRSVVLSDIVFAKDKERGIFFASSGLGSLTFHVPSFSNDDRYGKLYRLSLRIRLLGGTDYLLAQKAFQVAVEQVKRDLSEKHAADEKPVSPAPVERSGEASRRIFEATLREKESEIDRFESRLQAERLRFESKTLELYQMRFRVWRMEAEQAIDGLWRFKKSQKVKPRLPGQSRLRQFMGRTSGVKTAQAFGLGDAYQRIATSGLFDTAYYLGQGPDLSPCGGDGIVHYLLEGCIAGLDPHPLFHTVFYILHTPEIVQTGQNPLDHFIDAGAREGRDPCPYFITSHYLGTNPDVAASGMNPLAHYLSSGCDEGRWPHPLFDAVFYTKAYPEVADTCLNPLVDFALSVKKGEPKDPNRFFNSAWYLNRYPQSANQGTHPVHHYLLHGSDKNLNPCPFFEATYYRGTHRVVAASRMNPLAHYLAIGMAAGLSPHPLFEPTFYESRYPDVTASGMSSFDHYMTFGLGEIRNPHPLLDVGYLMRQVTDRKKAKTDPLNYYLETTDGSACHPHLLFNTDYYLTVHGDVAARNMQPLLHYLLWGAKEDRKPHPLFDPVYYRNQNQEDVAPGENPLVHYIWKGGDRCKNPHPLFDATYYVSRYPDVKEAGATPLGHFLSKGAQEGRYVSKDLEALSFQPRISVVVLPGQERGRKLGGCLLCLAAQLYPFVEIIPVMIKDDGEKENSRLQKLSETDPRIRPLFLDGPRTNAEAMNNGLRSATGDFVQFIPASVFLHCDGLLTLVKWLNRISNVDVMTAMGGDLDLSRSRSAEPHDGCNPAAQWYISPLVLLRKSVLDKLSGFETWHTGVSDPDFLSRLLEVVPAGKRVHLPGRIHDFFE